MNNYLWGKEGYGIHPENPLVMGGFPIRADQVNTLFGFPDGKKVPATFYKQIFWNGHGIYCLASQPDRKHRVKTFCPICSKWLTVGCLNQHMKIHKNEAGTEDPMGTMMGRNE